jgi:cation:H+ antiporter
MVDIAVPTVTFVVALAVLLKSSDLFTTAAGRLGLSLGISPFIIGATIVAGGTSLPELVSSVLAVLAGAPAIVVGSVIGSNIANIFLILGIAAVLGRRLRIDRELMRVDLPLLMASAAFLLVAVWDGPFVWYEGLLGLVGLGVYVHFTLSEEERLDEVVEELVTEHAELEADPEDAVSEELIIEPAVGLRTYLVIVGSLALVFVAADQLVRAILTLSAALDVGTEFVAITAVAIGTSLPEIAVSVVAVRKGEVEIAVGNVLGSNIFNTFAVMGVPSLLGVLTVPEGVRTYVLPVMVLATLLYYFITQDREITAWEGVTLLVLYVLFLSNLVSQL